MFRPRFPIRLGCLFGLAALSAQASVIVNFSGSVTFLDTALVGAFNTAQTISGSFTIDDSVSDSDVAANVGTFVGALGSFSATISGGGLPSYTFTLISPGSIEQFDARSGTSVSDEFRTYSLAPSGPTANGLFVRYFEISMFDAEQSAYLPAADPNSLNPLPDFSLFETQTFDLVFHCVAEGSGSCRYDYVSGTINSFTIVQPSEVPEPSSLSLLGLSLAAVSLALRKRILAG